MFELSRRHEINFKFHSLPLDFIYETRKNYVVLLKSEEIVIPPRNVKILGGKWQMLLSKQKSQWELRSASGDLYIISHDKIS